MNKQKSFLFFGLLILAALTACQKTENSDENTIHYTDDSTVAYELGNINSKINVRWEPKYDEPRMYVTVAKENEKFMSASYSITNWKTNDGQWIHPCEKLNIRCDSMTEYEAAYLFTDNIVSEIPTKDLLNLSLIDVFLREWNLSDSWQAMINKYMDRNNGIDLLRVREDYAQALYEWYMQIPDGEMEAQIGTRVYLVEILIAQDEVFEALGDNQRLEIVDKANALAGNFGKNNIFGESAFYTVIGTYGINSDWMGIIEK